MGRSPRGHSLLEILVSFSLLTIILLFVIGLFLNGYAVANTADQVTAAGHLAASDMTRFKDLDYTDLLALVSAPPQTSTVTQNGMEYTIVRQVTQPSTNPSDPDHDVLNLSVRVEWQEKSQLAPGAEARGLNVQLNSQISPVASF